MTHTVTRKLCAGAVAAAVVCILSLSPVTAAEDDEKEGPDPQQIARGANAWADVCSRCHNLRDPKELTDADWTVSVMHMRVRGNIPGQLARDIEAFLRASN